MPQNNNLNYYRPKFFKIYTIRNYYSSDRWDPSREILVSEARLEQMSSTCGRKKRQYVKMMTNGESVVLCSHVRQAVNAYTKLH